MRVLIAGGRVGEPGDEDEGPLPRVERENGLATASRERERESIGRGEPALVLPPTVQAFSTPPSFLPAFPAFPALLIPPRLPPPFPSSWGECGSIAELFHRAKESTEAPSWGVAARLGS